MQPNLALSYSSQSGDDPYVGVGWTLPLGRIERLRREGVPKFTDGDGFVVALPDGAIELVQVDASRFVALVDEHHIDVSRATENGGYVWRLKRPSGRIYTFGGTPASRTGPGGSGGHFAWHVTRIEDHNGNWIGLSYQEEAGIAYPTSVAWGANTNGIAAHRYAVHFEWIARASIGATTPLSFAAGFRQEQRRVLRTVRVSYFAGGVAPGATSTPIRQYELAWRVSPRTLRPLLEQVQLHGFTEAGDEEVLRRGVALDEDAPWEFEYLDQARPVFDTSGAAQPVPFPTFRNQACTDRTWPCDKTRDFIDLNGDGRPDALRTGDYHPTNNPHWDVWLNDGVGDFFESMTPWGAPDKEITRTGEDGTRQALIDVLNRDGRPDYVVARSDTGGWDIYENTGHGFAAPIQTTFGAGSHLIHRRIDADDSCPTCGVVTTWDVADLNGDGYPDRIGTANWHNTRQWDVSWGNGDGTFTPGTIVSPVRRIRDGSRRVFRDLFDINGDGLPDIVEGIGDVLVRGASSPVSGTGVRVVLQGNGSGAYHILTGFPVP